MAEQDKEVVKSEQILERYKQSNRSTWAEAAVEDRAFVANVQWESEDADSQEAANQPALTVNEVTPARDQVVSSLTKNSPRWMSYGKEKSDVGTASKVADLMEHIWYYSDTDTKNAKATEDFIDVGMWAMMAYVDTKADLGKGEIILTDIDPLELYIDPNAKRLDTEDAAHKLIYKRCTEDYIKVHYPDFDFQDAKLSYGDDYPTSTRSLTEGQVLKVTDDQEHKKYDIIDRYTKIKVKRYHVKDGNFESIFTEEKFKDYWNEPAIILVHQGQEEYITDERVQEWIQYYQMFGEIIHFVNIPQVTPDGQVQESLQIVPGVEDENSIPNSTTKIIPTIKGYLIQLKVIKVDEPLIDRIQRVFSIGGKLYFKDIMPISRYPIVTTLNHHSRNPFAMGDIRLVRPLQEQLNKVTSKITAYISAIVNLIGFVPKGSGIKKQLEEQGGKAGMKIFEIDTEVGQAPSFANYPPLPAGIFEDRQRIIAQIQRIMGAYPFLDGDASQAPETYRATLVLQEEGQNRSQYKRKKIETAINGLAKVVAEMIPNVYTEEKIVRLLKPNHQMKETTFNQTTYETGAREIINDLSMGAYDIVMISGSMLPTNRWARSEYYTGLFEKGILQDASVILRESEIPDVEEIIMKQDKLNQAMQYIQQLEAQMKQLGGQLQTKSREVIQAQEKVAVVKTQGKLDKLVNRAERDVMVGGMRVNDEVKKVKNKKKDKE